MLKEVSLEPLPKGKGETILVVDDEPIVRELVQQMLMLLGYGVLTACNGAEALAACDEHQDTIELVLTDVRMPEMNGFELSDSLKQVRPGLGLVFMTGYTPDDFTQLQHPTTWITKPLTLSRLAWAIREALDNEVTVCPVLPNTDWSHAM